MPLDFKRRANGAQLSARKLAQTKVSLREAGIDRDKVEHVLEGLLPFMNDESKPEEVTELAKTALAFVEAVKSTMPLADAFKAAADELVKEDLDEVEREVNAKIPSADRFMNKLRDVMMKELSRDPFEGRPMCGYGQGPNVDSARLPDQMADALYARMTGKEPRIGARYAGASLPEMAEACLRAAGRSTGSGSWLGGRGGQAVQMALHSTSDFPLILGNTVNRLMLDMYLAAQSGLKQVSRERAVADFRSVQGLRASGALEFAKVGEGGEFTYGTVQEAGETVSAATFGRVLGLSRQAIVNDDLGLFDGVARMLGEGAAQCEGKAFVGLLNANAGAGPTMSDANPLFHTSHGNIAATAAAIDVASLTIAHTAMRRQKDLANNPTSVTPTFLIVSPEQEIPAQKVLADLAATEVSEVNPFSGRLTLIVDAYLTSTTRWYLASAPGRPEGLTHVYLDGARGPQVFTQEGFDVDGMQFKGRLDFGCAFMDWRGWFMNPGA